MKLIVGTLVLSMLAGRLLGGRFANLGELTIRWVPVALAGLLLQVVVPPGVWPLVLLLASFVLLFAFTWANIDTVGFPAIMIGVVLNFVVIACNHGMPVSRQALEASGQGETLGALIDDGGAKHHLAADDDRLVFLGDVIAIPQPVGQAISVGDIFTYGGVGLLVASAMTGRTDSWVARRRSRRRGARSPAASEAAEVGHARG